MRLVIVTFLALLTAAALTSAYEVHDACGGHVATAHDFFACLKLPPAWPYDASHQTSLSAAAALSILVAGVLLVGTTVGLSARRCCGVPARAEYDRASIPSRLTFWWVTPTLSLALKNSKLDAADLPPLPASDAPIRLGRIFTRRWAAAATRGPYRLLAECSFANQKAVFAASFCAGWAFLAAMFCDPIILNQLLSTSEEAPQNATFATLAAPDAPPPASYVLRQLALVGLSALSMLVRVTCMELCYFFSKRVANNARTTLVLAVFRSTIRPHAMRVRGAAVGALTNLMATDADRIGRTEWFVWTLAQWTWSVVSLPFIIWMMWRLLGSAAFVAVATFVSSNWLSIKIYGVQERYQRRLQELRDVRGTLVFLVP